MKQNLRLQDHWPFVPSLFIEIRKRMGQTVFDVFESTVIDALDKAKARKTTQSQSTSEVKKYPPEDDDEPPAASGGKPGR